MPSTSATEFLELLQKSEHDGGVKEGIINRAGG